MSMGSSGLFLAAGGAVSLDGSFGSSMGWMPLALDASLLSWWDASRPDLITAPGGVSTSWKDIAHAYDKTAATTACPTYSGTSFNGAPGMLFNGTANCMTLASPTWAPSGAAGSEDWYLLDQLALASDTTVRFFGSWGGTGSANTQRRNGGLGETTAYHARATIGTGASTTSHTGATEIFGRHVIRYVTEPTQTWTEVDGVASTPTPVVPSTLTQNLRTGATPSTAAANFGNFILATRIITNPLTTAQADRLRAWLTRRL